MSSARGGAQIRMLLAGGLQQRKLARQQGQKKQDKENAFLDRLENEINKSRKRRRNTDDKRKKLIKIETMETTRSCQHLGRTGRQLKMRPARSQANYQQQHHHMRSHHWRHKQLLVFVAFTSLALYSLCSCVSVAEAVDCFKCSSRNGSNPACEDPFHNLNTTRVTSPILPDSQPNVIYHTPCYAGKKGREGLFPASACIKLTGVFDTTGETLVVRHCALDSGTLTQDTELARMSHCGKFQFEGDLLRGCVLACPEDACNSARTLAILQTDKMPSYLLLAVAALAGLPPLFLSRWLTLGQDYHSSRTILAG